MKTGHFAWSPRGWVPKLHLLPLRFRDELTSEGQRTFSRLPAIYMLRWCVCAVLQSGESVCLSWPFRIIHWKINFCTGATSPAIRQVTTFPHRSGGGFVMATTSSWAHEMKLLRPSGGVLWSHFTVVLWSHYHWTFQHRRAEIMLEFLLQTVITWLELIKKKKSWSSAHNRD